MCWHRPFVKDCHPYTFAFPIRVNWSHVDVLFDIISTFCRSRIKRWAYTALTRNCYYKVQTTEALEVKENLDH